MLNYSNVYVIMIAGTCGSGKSTVTSLLSKVIENNWKIKVEPIYIGSLIKFYSDNKDTNFTEEERKELREAWSGKIGLLKKELILKILDTKIRSCNSNFFIIDGVRKIEDWNSFTSAINSVFKEIKMKTYMVVLNTSLSTALSRLCFIKRYLCSKCASPILKNYNKCNICNSYELKLRENDDIKTTFMKWRNQFEIINSKSMIDLYKSFSIKNKIVLSAKIPIEEKVRRVYSLVA